MVPPNAMTWQMARHCPRELLRRNVWAESPDDKEEKQLSKNQKIRIRLKAYDHKALDQSAVKIVDTAKKLEKWARDARIDADLYYLGGGRFAVICDERYEARHLTIAQEINSVLASEVEIGEMSVKVMNNVCFIACPKDIDNPEFLLAFDGGLEAEVYSGELRYAEKLFDKKRFELRHDIMKIINRAFEEHLFTLHYQPVYSVRENRFVRAEAFLRLNDQNFGQIRPDLLISEAEKTNSIHAITAFVIEEVCRFLSMSEFLLLGFEYVEINLSPVQCMWSELLTVLLSTIRNYNVPSKK